jgi:hypothetical protein
MWIRGKSRFVYSGNPHFESDALETLYSTNAAGLLHVGCAFKQIGGKSSAMAITHHE